MRVIFLSLLLPRTIVFAVGATSDATADITESSMVQVTTNTRLEHCNICGTRGEFDFRSDVDYDTPDGVYNMACGELIWMFVKNNVYDGSSECLEASERYFDDCCYETPPNYCNICSDADGFEYYTDRTSLFMGSQWACAAVEEWFASKYEMTSDECKEGKTDHAYNCCFKKCTICGDSLPNWEVTVDSDGEQLKCNEFDIMFREENEKHDSSRCQMTQDLYSDKCCLPPLDAPCDLCQTQKSGMNLKSEETVSYEAELTTCLVVYTHMFSNVEDGSDKCTRAQKDLADQCCGTIDNDPASTPLEGNLGASNPASAPTEDALSAQWYAGSLDKSSSSMNAVEEPSEEGNRNIGVLVAIFAMGAIISCTVLRKRMKSERNQREVITDWRNDSDLELEEMDSYSDRVSDAKYT